MARLAVQAIQKMRGGAQSQLMLDSDSNLWVVKFLNNPQHVRILANELIATRLAQAIGLSVPACEIVEVSADLVAPTGDMRIEGGGGRYEAYLPGLQFGSRFVGGLMLGSAVDYLPESHLGKVRNLGEFAGILCLDKWLGNTDARQAVFFRARQQEFYSARFIDHGFCFNAGNWTFPNEPIRGIYLPTMVYAQVTGWKSFEPWITSIEKMKPNVICDIIKSVPSEWYDGDTRAIEQLTEKILDRRSRVRELIICCRKSDLNPFPNWV